jgi:hypothetical protein
LLLSLLIFVIFGVIGVKLFKGKLYNCKSGHVTGIDQIHADILIRDEYDCNNYGGQWAKFYTNFDDAISATMQIFIVAQTVGWDKILLRA